MDRAIRVLMTDEEIAEACRQVERFGIAVRMLRDATPFDLASFVECAKGASTDLDSLLATLQQRTKERDAALELHDPPEEPTGTYCDDDGERCESCCQLIPRGADIAEFTENDGRGVIRRVVMCHGPCSPSPLSSL